MPVISQSKPAPSRSGRLIVVLAVVALVGWGSWLAWTLLRQNDAQAYSQVVRDAEYLRGVHNYSGAVAAWQMYRDGHWPVLHLYESWVQQGALYETAGNCRAALVRYRQAEHYALAGPHLEYEPIARCSETLGDRATAVAYYQKTLDALPRNGTYGLESPFYINKIKTLKP